MWAESRRRGGAEAAAGPAGTVAAPETDGRQPEPGPGWAAQPAGLWQEGGAAGGLDAEQGAGCGHRAPGWDTSRVPTCSQPPLSQEEKPSLAALLQESPDKIQLTRRILDLKQVRGCWGLIWGELDLTAHSVSPFQPASEASHLCLLFLSLCGQEEQQFQSLHEELNSLAQKLEKQGKSESRTISARRKHLNKM